MPEPITKNARIFRAGTYPKKGLAGADFVVTVDDLKRIAANTPEVPIIFAHDETKERLDFGTGTNLRVEGNELHATLNLDAEAAPFVEKNGLKSLSAGIPFDLSKLQEISFTRRPHILDMGTFSEQCAWFSLSDEPESVDLFATFANTRHNTPAGQMALQDIHDACGRAGAVCDRANTAQMSSQHEMTAIQKIHDVTASHGAKCASGDAPNYGRSMYSQSEKPADERNVKMGFWDRFLGKDNATEAEKTEAKAELAQVVKEAVPAPADHSAQFTQLQKRIEVQDAELFANRMLASGRILPTQIATVIAEFSEAAEDDRLAPRIVTFSAGTESKQGSRVDRVKAKYENATPNRLTDELLPDGHYSALFNREHTGQTEEQKQAAQEKEYQDLRAQTSLGPVTAEREPAARFANSKKN